MCIVDSRVDDTKTRGQIPTPRKCNEIPYMQRRCCATSIYKNHKQLLYTLFSDNLRADVFFLEPRRLGDIDGNGLKVGSQAVSNTASLL